jgi:hypothetical protein
VLLLFGGLNDVPLEMELKNPPPVRLRNGDQITFNLDLFALFRQVTQELYHVTADGGDLRIFQL